MLHRPKNPYDRDIAVDVDSRFKMESDLVALTANYDQTWGSITSITAWNDYDYSTTTDVDRSELDILAVRNDNYSGDSLSQELRLSSKMGEQLDYQLGLFLYEQTTKRGDGSPFVYLGEDFLAIASQQDLPLPLPVSLLAALSTREPITVTWMITPPMWRARLTYSQRILTTATW
jgi:iron complex outermembrane receptor protein